MTTRSRSLAFFAMSVLAGAMLGTLARAESLFVDAGNPDAGDGTSRNPFRNLGSAVDAARARHQNSPGTTVIHVAPGTYTVPRISYAVNPPVNRWTQLDAPAGSLLFDFPNVKVLGVTKFELDDLGRPIRAVAGTETIVQVLPFLGDQENISRIAASRVTISGLIFEGHDGPFGSGGRFFNRAIDVDGQRVDPSPPPPDTDAGPEVVPLSGIVIRQNLFRNVALGFHTRLASMTVEQNRFGRAPEEPGGPGGLSTGGSFCAGTADHPAVVRFACNVSTGNRQGVGFQAVTNNDKPPVDPDAAADQSLVLEVAYNDLRGNKSFGAPNPGTGIGILVDGLTGNPTKPVFASADIHDNLLDGGEYGVVVDAVLPTFLAFGPAFPEIPSYHTNAPGAVVVTIANNTYSCVTRNRALFAFTRSGRSVGALGAGASMRRYLRCFTFDVTDLDGELAGNFDQDDPLCDPEGTNPGDAVCVSDDSTCGAGATLGNMLLYNGSLVPNGKTITAPHSCP